MAAIVMKKTKVENREVVDGTTLTDGWDLEGNHVEAGEKELERQAEDLRRNVSKNNQNGSQNDFVTTNSKGEVEESRVVEGKEDETPEITTANSDQNYQFKQDRGQKMPSPTEQHPTVEEETSLNDQNGPIMNSRDENVQPNSLGDQEN